MTNHSNVKLTAAENSNLWTAYLNDSMILGMVKHFMNNVADEDVRNLLNKAQDISNGHINTIIPLLKEDGASVPIGFSDNDVNINAPRLFSDTYYMFYLANAAQFGMTTYGLSLYHSARTDVRKFFTDALKNIIDFYNNLQDIMLSKGVYIRSPIVTTTRQNDIIDNKGFFAGIFSGPRSMILTEVSSVFSNMLTCFTGRSLLQGFSQCATTPEVSKHLFRGKQMLENHIDRFSNYLKDEGIPTPSTSDMSVTDSTFSPFSDKLMLFHTAMLNVVQIRNYTDAIASSMRNDIAAEFTRLTVEVTRYTADSMEIMVRNGWMEQPPQIINHNKLVNA